VHACIRTSLFYIHVYIYTYVRTYIRIYICMYAGTSAMVTEVCLDCRFADDLYEVVCACIHVYMICVYML